MTTFGNPQDDYLMSPVERVFLDTRNMQLLLTRIGDRTGVYNLQPDSLQKYQRLALGRFPGSYQPNFFSSQAEYTRVILEHVELMNQWVVECMIPEVKAGEYFMNAYNKTLGGQNMMPDQPAHVLRNDQSPKSNSVLLRDATQWNMF